MKSRYPFLTTVIVLTILSGLLLGPGCYAWVFYHFDRIQGPSDFANHLAWAQRMNVISQWCLVFGFAGLTLLIIADKCLRKAR